MGFPIAVGAKQVSSRPISGPDPVENFARTDDQVVVQPSAPTKPCLFYTSTPHLQAIVTLYYYDMIREDTGEIDYSIAELKVQIVPSSSGFQTSYRDSCHKIELPSNRSSRNRNNGNMKDECEDETPRKGEGTSPSAVISSDHRFLTCLIPQTAASDENTTAVVVFQLRRPHHRSNHPGQRRRNNHPTLPPYIQTTATALDDSSADSPLTTTTPSCVVVATNPRVLKKNDDDDEPLTNATSLCDAGTTIGGGGDTAATSTASMLLVACRDGAIHAVSYRPLVIAGLLHQFPVSSRIVTAMDHVTDSSSVLTTTTKNGGDTVGSLAVTFNTGAVTVFQSHMTIDYSTTTSNIIDDSTANRYPIDENSRRQLLERNISVRSMNSAKTTSSRKRGLLFIALSKTHESISSDNIVYAKWIATSYLAVMHNPSGTCVLQVIGLYDRGCHGPISTFELTCERLKESRHTSFLMDPWEDNSIRKDVIQQNLIAMEYDLHSDCIAASSYIMTDDALYPFVCVWNWRTNAQGYTSMCQTSVSKGSVSRLSFAQDAQKRRKVVHLLASASPTRIRKEMLQLALLSPPRERVVQGATMPRSSTLLLSSNSVSYLHATKVSPRANFELKWVESMIPKSYLAAFGAPTIATIGGNYGRSIAVAAARGVCVLNWRGAEIERQYNSCSIEQGQGYPNQQESSLTRLLRAGHILPRWHLFRNEADERSFRIVAMSWWENTPGVTSDRFQNSDDILVAILEVHQDCSSGYYLACWSSGEIDLKKQLIQTERSTEWGLPLDSFTPGSLDLLDCPSHVTDQRTCDLIPRRRACVMLVDQSPLTEYSIYQLQVVGSTVVAKCGAASRVGIQADLFLGSASFSFNFDAAGKESTIENHCVATVGVVQKNGGGISVVALSQSSTIATGKLILPVGTTTKDPLESEVARFWLSDIVSSNSVGTESHTWIVELMNGRLVSWSVPDLSCLSNGKLVSRNSEIDARMIHSEYLKPTSEPEQVLLGTKCSAGTMAGWMQKSTNGARNDFLLGSVPKSSFGYVVGVAQSCRKLHRSLGEDFEKSIFRPDFLDHEIFCPGDATLYPPASLASMYTMALDSPSGDSHTSPSVQLSNFQLHVAEKMKNESLRQSLVMSLQLIVLRCVEKSAKFEGKHDHSSKDQSIAIEKALCCVVQTLRIHTTPLQFNEAILSVARQMEPSSLAALFPLPSNGNSKSRETLEGLSFSSLVCGSIVMAVSSLPILNDAETIRDLCTRLFHRCLEILDCGFQHPQSYEFDLPQEERATAGELFRYYVKLDDCIGETSSTDSDGESNNTRRRYSIFCGVPQLVRSRRKKKGSASPAHAESLTPFLMNEVSASNIKKFPNIERLSPWLEENYSHKFKSVVGVAARYILSSIFCPTDNSVHGTRPCPRWKKVSAMAGLLMGDSGATMRACSRSEFSELVLATKENRYTAMMPLRDRNNGNLAAFLRITLDECEIQIESACSGKIFDLVQILLGNVSSDMAADVPGLLIVAVTTAHGAGRITDILMNNSHDDPLWSAYFQAQ